MLTICIYLYTSYIQLYRLRLSEFHLKPLFIMNFLSGFLKEWDFPSIIILQILHRLLLRFVTPCLVFFSLNVEEVNNLLRFWGYLGLLMIFDVSSISLSHKSGMADHIWKENGNHLPLWDKVEIIDTAEHWRMRRLKESAHMLGYNDLLSRPSIELNTICELIIKKAR